MFSRDWSLLKTKQQDSYSLYVVLSQLGETAHVIIVVFIFLLLFPLLFAKYEYKDTDPFFF